MSFLRFRLSSANVICDYNSATKLNFCRLISLEFILWRRNLISSPNVMNMMPKMLLSRFFLEIFRRRKSIFVT
jgi:hypothetical protein